IKTNTPVISMLGMIPECSVSCVMEDLFTSGGCPMTTAKDLAACACTNITMQATLSTCVQESCGFLDQNQVVAFASGLCEAYPKDSRVNELKTASIVTIVLTTIFLFLRLYSRWLKTRRLWSDDAYAIIAAVLLIIVSIIILEMSLKGFGLHYWNVPTPSAVELQKLFYVCQMLYVAVQIFSKVAILALYSRLFPDFIEWFRWSVRGMIAFMLIHGLVFFLLVVFQCWPIRSIWDKTITDAKCLPISAVIGFTGAGLSIMEDIIILLLPLPVVWKLQMSTRKKISVIFLICVGSFASITSIVRLKFVVKYSNSFDSTWDNADVIKWSLIEILSACICGNLLPLRPLIEQIMPPFRSIYSWYSDSRSSRKSSEKTSLGFRRFGRSGGS
ncbi:integral membrane protein, partial [Macroventuria anomochaeta]